MKKERPQTPRIECGTPQGFNRTNSGANPTTGSRVMSNKPNYYYYYYYYCCCCCCCYCDSCCYY